MPTPDPVVDLSVLVVSYNSRPLIDTLLRTLAGELTTLRAEVIVVDNASQDGTAEHIRIHYPWVRLLASELNLGFAAANNRAAQAAAGRMLLLLNPDALPEPGAIASGLARMDRHPEVGLAGGRLLDTAGQTQPSARMFPTPVQELMVLSGLAARYPRSRVCAHLDRGWADPGKAAAVDWVPGAFALVPKALFLRLGGFDERFFLYYEEVDLCRRIRASGLQVMYWPELRIHHIGGASARTVAGAAVSRSGAQLTLWRARSGLLYYRKHHGWLGAWLVNRIERGWHGLRRWRAMACGLKDKAGDSDQQGALLSRAWRETLGGRVAPPRPW